jgi:hypothetical protein
MVPPPKNPQSNCIRVELPESSKQDGRPDREHPVRPQINVPRFQLAISLRQTQLVLQLQD